MPASSDLEGGGRVPVGLRARRLTHRRMLVVGTILVAVAVVEGGFVRRHAASTSPGPPPARLGAAPGAGFEAASPIRGGVNTYGGLWLSNGDRRPVVLTHVRLIGVTPGFRATAQPASVASSSTTASGAIPTRSS